MELISQQGLCKDLSDDQFDTMIDVALSLGATLGKCTGQGMAKNHHKRKIKINV